MVESDGCLDQWTRRGHLFLLWFCVVDVFVGHYGQSRQGECRDPNCSVPAGDAIRKPAN